MQETSSALTLLFVVSISKAHIVFREDLYICITIIMVSREYQVESAGVEESHCEEQSHFCSSIFDLDPTMTHFNSEEFQKEGCFTKGCKWAPDGSCILTNSEDNTLRIWNLPQELYSASKLEIEKSASTFSPVLLMKEGGLIYDYCWYPPMSSWDPLTCCFGSVSRDSPTHLWDAFTGRLRATYRAYNQVDEVEAARSLAFDSMGQKLFCGFHSCVRVFDVSIPGRSYSTRNLKTSSGTSQTGIVSCIATSPAINSLFAVGTYSGTIGLYVDESSKALCILQGHEGGLTHLKFSSDGLYLYSGGRQDTEIVCWDLREPGKVLFAVPRIVKSHQRVYFDLTPDGRFLMSGTTDGHVCIWDTNKVRDGEKYAEPGRIFKAHNDCTNGISIHGSLPVIATSSGQRHHVEYEYSSDEDCPQKQVRRKPKDKENCLKLWWIGPIFKLTDGRRNNNMDISQESVLAENVLPHEPETELRDVTSSEVEIGLKAHDNIHIYSSITPELENIST